MTRGALILLVVVLGLGLYLWLVEMPAEEQRVTREAAETKLTAFQESDVRAFTLLSPAQEIEVTRASGGQWTITKPRRLEADRQDVEEFLRALQLAKVQRVVNETGADLQAYGLAPPSLTVSLRLASGKQTLRFGGAGPLSSTLYAMREGAPKVLLTSLAGREVLTKSVEDFRRKRVLRFDRDRVSRLKVATPRETVVLYKEGQGEKAVWKIKAPVETAADQPEVRSLLYALEDLKARAFLDDPADRQAKRAASGKPLVTVTLHEGEADRLLSVFQDARDGTTAYARTASEEPLYVIASAAAHDLAKSFFTLREKQLIAAEPDRVKTLIVKKDGEEYALTHEGGGWLVDGDPGAKADAARMNMFITRVVRLQAERIVTDSPAALKPYGLDPPAAELIATDAQGKMLGRIAFGRQEQGLAYANGSAMAGVFQVRPDILQEIPKKADAIASGRPPQQGKDGPQ